MKTILKIYAIPIIFTLFVIGGLINQCNKPKKPTEPNLRHYLIDSIESVQTTAKVAEIERVQDSLSDIAEGYKMEVNVLKKRRATIKAKSDKLISYVPLEDTICWATLNSKQAEIDTLQLICDNLDKEAATYSRKLYLCENQAELQSILLQNKSKDIERLNNEVISLQKSNKRSWVERNKIWLGALGGVFGTLLIIK